MRTIFHLTIHELSTAHFYLCLFLAEMKIKSRSLHVHFSFSNGFVLFLFWGEFLARNLFVNVSMYYGQKN